MNSIKLKKVSNNIGKMLKERGYDCEKLVCKEQMMFIKKEIMVYFIIEPKLKSSKLKQEFELIHELYEKVLYKKLILVLNVKPTNSLSKIIKAEKKKYDIQIFWLNELVIDKINHKLVPKHILIENEEEIEWIKKTFKLKNLLNLPYILRTDPIVKYYDAKPGQIFKIVRNNITSGKYCYYRYVY